MKFKYYTRKPTPKAIKNYMDIFTPQTEDFLKNAIKQNPKAADLLLGKEEKLPKWIKEGVNFRKTTGGVRFTINKIDEELRVLFITAHRYTTAGPGDNKFTYSFNAMIKLCDNNLIQQM